MRSPMKKEFTYCISLIAILISFSSCIAVKTNSITVFPETDSTEFMKNHASMTKKVYAHIIYAHYFDKKTDEEINDIELKNFENTLKSIHFAEFVPNKNDADYIMEIDDKFYNIGSFYLLFLSTVTLHIIPTIYDSKQTIKITVTNKGGEKK